MEDEDLAGMDPDLLPSGKKKGVSRRTGRWRLLIFVGFIAHGVGAGKIYCCMWMIIDRVIGCEGRRDTVAEVALIVTKQGKLCWALIFTRVRLYNVD